MSLDDNPYVAPRPIDPHEGRGEPGTILPGGDEGPPVVVRYRMTVDEFDVANREHAHRLSPLRSSIMMVISAFIGLFALIGSISLIRMVMQAGAMPGADDPRRYVPWIVCLLIGIYWFILRRPFNRWKYRQAIRRIGGEAEVEWRIWPGRLESDAKLLQTASLSGSIESITRSTIGWEAYVGGARTDRGIMLSLSPSMFHWLPRHGFADEDDYGRVAVWAREKVHKFIDAARK